MARSSKSKTSNSKVKSSSCNNLSNKRKKSLKKMSSTVDSSNNVKESLPKNRVGFRNQAIAILLFSLSILLACIIFIQGENVWNFMHELVLGLFGTSSILWSILFTYISISISLEKPYKSISFKLWMSILVIVLFCSSIYIFKFNDYQNGTSYFKQLLVLYKNGIANIGSGLFSGLLGIPMIYLFGFTGSKVIILIMLFISIMFLTGTSLIQLFRWIRKPLDVVVDNVNASKIENNRRKNKDFNIDIPLDPEGMPVHPVKSVIFDNDSSNEKLNKLKKAFNINSSDNVENDLLNNDKESINNKDKIDDVSKLINIDLTNRKQEQFSEESKFPPLFLLKASDKINDRDVKAELEANGEKLVSTLDSFNVKTSIVNTCRGPAVTRYELQPAAGVKISKITSLADDIALNLASSGVRIEAPIPGKAAVGIEVPNKIVSVVKMQDLVKSSDFQNASSKLTVVLGKDIAGNVTLADLSKMPHLLIAGSTGSGKSVCINSFIISLLYKSTPQEVRMLMIDPKVVELGIYNGIPQLLVPVVTDPRKAAGALNWAVNEMLNRYKIFADNNVRDLTSYNQKVLKNMRSKEKKDSNEQQELMPQIVIIIDELADLMMAAPNEVEDAICRLAQMARAAGMHLVIATQRPSVDVITGIIKANIPSRIALAVSSQVDSRTILDMSGAEKLLGRGDMLFSPVGAAKPKRVQGCYVTDEEIETVIDYIKKTYETGYDEQVIEEIEKNAIKEVSNKDDGYNDLDPMLQEAIRLVSNAGQASTSYLQRKLKLGYARAGRIMDQMEERGIVSPSEGSKPRQVLITYSQWLEMNMKKNDDI